MPNFSNERRVWKRGFRAVAGLDEVGRGAFAGPVVTGAVVFSPDWEFKIPDSVRIDDSKKLTAKQREAASRWIKKNAASWGIGEASVTKINKLGIKKATEIAFRRAISQVKPDYLLIDAFFVPYVKGLRRKNQTPIINGDEKSLSIAAASIIAKVHRDHLMENLAKKTKYKKYRWDKNKGYGTLNHRKAIKKYGITKLHRSQFVKNCVSSQV